MNNVVNINPLEILNVKGFNRATLNGQIPLFSPSPFVSVQVVLTKEGGENKPGDANGSFHATLQLDKKDFPELTEEAIKTAVLSQLNLTEAKEAIKA